MAKIKVADFRKFYKELIDEKITMSRMVEKLNEVVNDQRVENLTSIPAPNDFPKADFVSEPGYTLIEKEKPADEQICDFITDRYTYHTGLYIAKEDLFLLEKNGDFFHSCSVLGWKKSFAKIEFQ